MNFMWKIVFGGLIVLVAASAALAETKPEYRFNSGTCDNGAQWWSVSIYYDGVLTMIEGINCDGEYYRRWQCPNQQVAYDPTAGLTPTHTGVCDQGGTWRSVITWTAGGEPAAVVGVDCTGSGYVATCEELPSTGP